MKRFIEGYTQVDAALALVLSKIRVARKAETIPSLAAYGRVSAEDVLAPSDVPPFPTSHWDGYAVMADDLKGVGDSNQVSLKVVGRAGPGGRSRASIAHGEAFQVVTGAPLPSGADAVVPSESALRKGGRVLVREPVERGSHVYTAGEDVKKGEVVLPRGQAIRAQDQGLLVSLGVPKIRVWKRPRVSVVATGSELTDASKPERGKVVNSHSPVFLRLCERLGCVPIDLGIAGDSKPEISRKLRRGLAGSDLVMTLGGTSAGERDYVTESIESLGPAVLVHGIKMDRGRVAGVGVVGTKPVLVMPGPVQGAMNAFILLGVPVIEVLKGARVRGAEVTCSFTEPWEARRKYADFRKVVYVKTDEGYETARPLGAETESMKVLVEADGYVVVPENVTRIDAGERAVVRLLPGISFP